MAETERKFRVCEIDYTNVWPITYYYPISRFDREIEVVRSVPSELNRKMMEGAIDMGPISSFAYGASFERYLLLPDLSVSAYGPVQSILYFYRGDLDEAKNGNIALTTTSATSVNLLKIILGKFHQGNPTYRYAAPSLHAMMSENDGALLIGDDAIRSSWEDHGYRVMDLGAEWTRQTGHSMTFAVWAVRKEAALQQPELVARIHGAYLDSKRKAKADPTGIVTAAVDRLGGNREYWSRYFDGLSHDFSRSERAGLKLYYEYAVELGLLPRTVPLQFIQSMQIG